MATTLVIGVLLAFGRWADANQLHMGLTYIVQGAFPPSWILVIEYGVLSSMVAAFIRADRVDRLYSSTDTLIWLGGICLFTAGLYHDAYGHRYFAIWGSSVNGYGTLTVFLHRPLLANLPLLLSVWPMGYAVIVVCTSFVALMGWRWSILRWRWILHALYLVGVTTSWIMLVLLPWNMKYDASWLGGSLIVLTAILIALAVVRDFDRKIQWMNLIAAVWLLTALSPRFGARPGPIVGSVKDALRFISSGYQMLVLGDLLILGGCIAVLFSKAGGGSAPELSALTSPRLCLHLRPGDRLYCSGIILGGSPLDLPEPPIVKRT